MSKTQENLLKAFAGESQARNKYTYFASVARKEGYIWIQHVFEETADNERAHAEREYKLMKGKVEMTNTYDIAPMGTTLENLKMAAAGEKHEWTSMYPDFEKIARQEGETIVAETFKQIAEIEEKHEERYLKLAKKLESGQIFKSDSAETEWKCLNCGYIHKGKEAPQVCPACAHPQAYYMQIGFVR